ncbi:MAG: transcription antitermination protein NusB [Gilvibacter sp.]
MLTRRHIRIKVLQNIYAFNKTDHGDLAKQEKFLVYSIEQTRDLHLLLLALLAAIHKHAQTQIEKRKQLHLASKEDLNPDRSFVDNPIFSKISDNPFLADLVKKQKLDVWEHDNEYVSLLYKDLIASELYEDYLAKPAKTLEDHRQFAADMFKKIVAPNDKLYDYLEDKRLTWLDDFPLVNTGLVKMLRKISPATEDSQIVPDLYKNDDDLDFGIKLFKKVVLKDEELTKDVIQKTPNWDKERIADMDMILIKMGLAEFLFFPSIPVKVTINEYLEIAKEYSTPKSSIFINGILDKSIGEYTASKRLNKIGRGLR